MTRPNSQQPPPEYKVVIAYDFGTTYSGAAYAFTHSTPTEIFDIQNWPQKDGNFYPKVPTVLSYQRNNQQQTERLTISGWGHGAKKAMLKPGVVKQNVLISKFKLHLDESLKLPLLENGLTPVQAIADYLYILHKHTLEELSRGFVDNYHPNTFRYCLTVPAVWSDKAKHLMRKAAIQAGIITHSDPPDRLVLVSEPEAAAIYCEETMSEQVQLKDKDRIMICDAGGGTVDLIVFQVNFKKSSQNGNSPERKKRELKEVTKGIGESCGSVFLDDHFQKLLRKKLGRHVMNKITPREMYGMLEYFSSAIKTEFNGVDDHFMELPRSVQIEDLPAHLREKDDDGCLDEGMLKLSSQELKNKVFDPVVQKVLSFIEQQYRQIPDGQLNFLFLVGGFGSSKYLYQRVCEEFQDTMVKKIACPTERAALAVVRGAVYYGLNPRVVATRVTRRTYGVNTRKPFEENIDPPSKRVVNPNGDARCKGRFKTFTVKNEELPVDHCISKGFHVYYESQKTINVRLYATENNVIPRYCDDSNVKCIATMKVPVPELPNVKKNELVDYTIRMYFGRTEIRMEAEFETGQIYDVNCDFDAINKYDLE